MTIFAQEFDHFCLYFPETLINLLKHDIFLNKDLVE